MKSMILKLVLLIIILKRSETACPSGYSYTPSECLPCPGGTYMSHDHHVYKKCNSCTKADFSLHEITLTNCTSTSDTEIGCKEGYFRDSKTYDLKDCTKCSVCEYNTDNTFQARACGPFSDTVCCPQPGMLPDIDGRLCTPGQSPNNCTDEDSTACGRLQSNDSTLIISGKFESTTTTPRATTSASSIADNGTIVAVTCIVVLILVTVIRLCGILRKKIFPFLDTERVFYDVPRQKDNI